jgi:hypothetical protein
MPNIENMTLAQNMSAAQNMPVAFFRLRQSALFFDLSSQK